MKAFTVETGIVIPLDRANVDTDFIIPKQFLKSIKRTGFGPNLFDEHRYLDKGEPDQDCSEKGEFLRQGLLREVIWQKPGALRRRIMQRTGQTPVRGLQRQVPATLSREFKLAEPAMAVDLA